MKRITGRLRLPTPSIVIASIALFVSLGGVSYGLASGSIDGREVKNRSLTGVDMKGDKVGGGAIKESSLSTVPLADGISHAVSVNAAGVSVRARGVTTTAPQGNGRYQVLFDRNVQGCFYNATIANVGVSANPANGQVSVSVLPTNGNAVLVETTNAGGTRANRPFHLVVSC